MPHIKVIGPSSHIEKGRINDAVTWLENKGATVSIADQVYYQDHQSAGTIQDKLDALHNAFADTSVDGIVTSCGGNQAIHLLPSIDYELIRANPKPLFGFSDITILLNGIYAKTGLTTYHGPTMTQIVKPLPDNQLTQFWDVLNGQLNPITWDSCTIVNEGTASGTLIGGNLSVFQAMIGTPYLPDTKQGPYILFFEDVGDELSRYDRMLAHIRISGWMDNASAIIFGDFHSTDNASNIPFGHTINEIIAKNTNGLNIPIITNAPFGHRGNLWTLPVGKTTTLQVNNNIVNFKFS
jgi:muramoyltetrapeptide carboxypeptidase